MHKCLWLPYRYWALRAINGPTCVSTLISPASQVFHFPKKVAIPFENGAVVTPHAVTRSHTQSHAATCSQIPPSSSPQSRRQNLRILATLQYHDDKSPHLCGNKQQRGPQTKTRAPSPLPEIAPHTHTHTCPKFLGPSNKTRATCSRKSRLVPPTPIHTPPPPQASHGIARPSTAMISTQLSLSRICFCVQKIPPPQNPPHPPLLPPRATLLSARPTRPRSFVRACELRPPPARPLLTSLRPFPVTLVPPPTSPLSCSPPGPPLTT